MTRAFPDETGWSRARTAEKSPVEWGMGAIAALEMVRSGGLWGIVG